MERCSTTSPPGPDLAAAVVGAGLAEHQDALLHKLGAADTPADGVQAVVVRHLRWIEDHQQLARLLLGASLEVARGGLDATALTANRRFFIEVAGWLRVAGWSGTPELAVLVALWIGPAQEYAPGLARRPAHPTGSRRRGSRRGRLARPASPTPERGPHELSA
jgi:hypothetical protein